MKTGIVKTKKCENCGVIFEKLYATSKHRWNLQRFCSIKCSGTLIGKDNLKSPYIREALVKKFKKQREQKQQGVLNNNWKVGVSYPFVKKCVLIRDKYTCQNCNFSEPEIMEVDHIKPKSEYPELKKDMNNLITLCPNCHRRKTNKELIEKSQNVNKQLKDLMK